MKPAPPSHVSRRTNRNGNPLTIALENLPVKRETCWSNPRESLAAKVAGVAVAAVRFDVDGRAQSVEILEAPDEHTAAAVREAVSRWTVPGVKVNDRPEAVSVRGKLTFYFQLALGSIIFLVFNIADARTRVRRRRSEAPADVL